MDPQKVQWLFMGAVKVVILLYFLAVSGVKAASTDPVDQASAEKARAYNRYYLEVKKSKDQSPGALNKLRKQILAPSQVEFGQAVDKATVRAQGQVGKGLKRPDGKPVVVRPSTVKEEKEGPTKHAGKRSGKDSNKNLGSSGTAPKMSNPPSNPVVNPVVGGQQQVDEITFEGKKKKVPPKGKE